MHSAPAVSYPVGRSRFQGWLLVLTGLASVLVGLIWFRQSDLAGWRQGLYVATLLGTCVMAVQAWRRSPCGSLRWDGQAWSWTERDVSVCAVLSVHLDLQFFLLLSLRTDTGSRIWLWPERRTMAVRWNALRRAVFSHRGAGQGLTAYAEAALAQVKS
ncbi:MAG: hypothetical protein HHJ17_07600 [Rhodoferax sp.]|uniref:hypothetical protein n=1 Tax=Rhodoferax sp. TaxID=50421 RepID=UPI0018311E60|nr:hypothetical protein [Rhodoferax sp.]NMM13387.1 hypothetical protein [Rhodoferax sp.]